MSYLFLEKRMDKRLQGPPGIDISADIKGERFFVTSDYMFMFITAEGYHNQVCIFSDEITNKAREYADNLVPEIGSLDKDRKDFINQHRVNYWSRLFHLFIWDLLAENNTLTYMKRP